MVILKLFEFFLLKMIERGDFIFRQCWPTFFLNIIKTSGLGLHACVIEISSWKELDIYCNCAVRGLILIRNQ